MNLGYFFAGTSACFIAGFIAPSWRVLLMVWLLILGNEYLGKALL